MQVCISLQTDNHASTPALKVFYRPDALPAAQPTASKHWRQKDVTIYKLNKSLKSLSTQLKKSVFSFLRQLICKTALCQWMPRHCGRFSAVVPSGHHHRSIYPARRAHCSKPAAAACSGWLTDITDRRSTLYCYIDPATFYTSNVNKFENYRQFKSHHVTVSNAGTALAPHTNILSYHSPLRTITGGTFQHL